MPDVENKKENKGSAVEDTKEAEAETERGKSPELNPDDTQDKDLAGAPKRPKKMFRFSRPIEEIYDETACSDDQNLKPGETDAGGGKNDDGRPAAESRGGGTKRGCLKTAVYTTVILAISVALALLVLSAFADMYGVGKSGKQIRVSIPKGASSAVIATTLKKSGVINNDLFFRLYVKQNKCRGFQSGTYLLKPSLSYEEIVSTLKNPANNHDIVSVMIREGATAQEIAQTLEKDGICSSRDFLSAVTSGSFTFGNSSGIADSSKCFYRYEGYLFPDTYKFYKSTDAKTVAQKMLDNFDAKFTPELKEKAASINMTVAQTITLASIIQSESGKSGEMSKVSSVFHNRLTTGVNGKKLLQSDATVLYAKKKTDAQVVSADTEVISSYNTYKYEGLTPGPICNPGIEAIKAALYPENTSYFYFVTDKDGNYYYADTFEEHTVNVKKAMANGGATGTQVVK